MSFAMFEGCQVAKAAVLYVGWMTLFSSTIAIAERWTDEASSTLRQAASALILPILALRQH